MLLSKGKLLVTIIAAMLLFAPALCHAGPTTVAVLPLANETGDPSLDWLSVGLQDSITIDLSYVDGLNVLVMSQYVSKAKMGIAELGRFSRDMAIWLGSRTGADQMWSGSFSKSQDDEIEVEVRGLDVRTGKYVFYMSIAAPINRLLSAESALVVEILKTLGIELSDEQKAMIASLKTGSLRAFELNARGYGVQQGLSLKGYKEREGFYAEWVSLLREAVNEDPGYAEAWVNLGWACYTTGDRKSALKAFENALALKPYLMDANIGVGYVMRDDRKDHAKAIEHMARAVDLNPSLEWTNRELIDTIVKAEGKAALPYIMKMLDNERKSIRVAAIEALGRFKDASSLPELGGFTRDSDEDIRKAAVEAIGDIGTDAAIPYLEEALVRSEEKRKIVVMILAINEEAGVQHLIEMLRDTSTEECIYAAKELGRRKAVSAVPYLIEAVKEFKKLSIASMRALSAIGNIKAVPALIEALGDERRGVRVVAAAILGERRARDAVPALREMARGDEDPYLRLRALISLAMIGDKKAISSLAKVVRGDDKEKTSYVVRRVLQRPKRFLNTELGFLFEKSG